MTDWHPPAPSAEYPSMRTPGMRGRVQDHPKRPATVELVVAGVRGALADYPDPAMRQTFLAILRLLEVEHRRAELAEAEVVRLREVQSSST